MEVHVTFILVDEELAKEETSKKQVAGRARSPKSVVSCRNRRDFGRQPIRMANSD
jgi:hypothetical protein